MTTVISGTDGIDKVKDGTIVQADLASPFYLPSPQTWQTFSVPAARTVNTTYPNETGQPIKIAFRGQNAVAAGYMILDVVVAGVTVSRQTMNTSSANQELTGYAEIPDGANYSVNFTGSNTPTPIQWAELR